MKKLICPRFLTEASLDFPTGACITIGYERILETIVRHGLINLSENDVVAAIQVNSFGITFVLEKSK